MARVRCKKCGVILESKSVHDFQQCDCENETFVDGGNEYTRAGGKDLSLVEVIREDELVTDLKRA